MKKGAIPTALRHSARKKGGLARAAKIRAEKAARGETTRRRRPGRSKWSEHRDPYSTPEYRARVAAEQASSAPAHPHDVVPMGPGLGAWSEAIELSRERGGFEVNLRSMFRERDRELIDV